MHATTVADVMSRDVVTVEPTMPVKDVTEVLVRHGISAVAVVDACRNVLGVITEADLLRRKEHEDDEVTRKTSRFTPKRLRDQRRKATGRTAADVMTSPAITVRPIETLPTVARLFADAGIRRAFVVDDGWLVGVVARRDLLRAYLRSDDAIRTEIDRDVFGRLLHANPRMVRTTVEHGVVTLTGRVEYESDIDVAVRRIAGVRGVVAVNNRLDYCWNGSIDRPEPATDDVVAGC